MVSALVESLRGDEMSKQVARYILCFLFGALMASASWAGPVFSSVTYGASWLAFGVPWGVVAFVVIVVCGTLADKED